MLQKRERLNNGTEDGGVVGSEIRVKKGEDNFMSVKEFFDVFYYMGMVLTFPIGFIAISTDDIYILPCYLAFYLIVLFMGMIVC